MQDQAVFRAIADPTRREILSMLAAEEMTVGAIAARFDMTRPAVAKHLGILTESGLIAVERRGRERVNRLQPEALQPARDWLDELGRFWDDKLAKLKTAIEEDHGDG